MTKPKQTFGRFPSSFVLGLAWANLSGQAKAVLVVLITHADKKQQCFLLRETIRRQAGLKQVVSVSTALRELEEAKLIEREARFDHLGRSISNLFTLLIDAKETPFGRIPTWIVDDEVWAKLSFRGKSLLVALAGLTAGNTVCDTAKGQLAKLSRIGNRGTFAQALAELTDAQLVREEKSILPDCTRFQLLF